MDRRKFLARMAQLGGAAAVGGLAGCRSEERPDDTPVETANDDQEEDEDDRETMSTVAVVVSSDRADGVHRAVELLDHDFRARDVFIKPNFNSADPAPGSTHNSVLEALVRHVHSQRPSKVTVGDRSGMADTREVMQQKQIFAMGNELRFDVVVFDELDADQWQIIDEPDHHWERGFALPKPVVEADAYVQTCCLKTHRFGGHFTMALKNNVGLAARKLPDDPYNFMGELHDSPHQRLMIAEINDAVEQDLIVLDGVTGFYEKGPEAGPVAHFNAVIAGTDPVAIDALGVALLRRHGTTPELMGQPVRQLDQIRRAVQLGVGTADPEKIDFLTPDDASDALVAELVGILSG